MSRHQFLATLRLAVAVYWVGVVLLAAITVVGMWRVLNGQ